MEVSFLVAKGCKKTKNYFCVLQPGGCFVAAYHVNMKDDNTGRYAEQLLDHALHRTFLMSARAKIHTERKFSD